MKSITIYALCLLADVAEFCGCARITAWADRQIGERYQSPEVEIDDYR